MNRYGQTITWSAMSAPHLFTGECTSYSYDDTTSETIDDDEAGDARALILHSRQADISFEAKIKAASTDFLNLSAGAAITVSGITTGVVLVSRAVETWRLNQAKTASITAKHYPEMTQASPVMAGASLNAFTPTQTGLDGIVSPGGVIIYSTVGLTHADGVVHGLTLEQMLTITPDEPSPDGKILGAAAHGYARHITLDLLCTAAPPAVRSVLTIGGAPAHASDYRIRSVRKTLAEKRGAMYAIAATWIPPLTTS